jgi:hypothetical protein
MMLNKASWVWLVGGIWSAALVGLIATSMALGARLSTSALLFVVGAAPAVVMMLIGAGAPSRSVAEILRSVNADDGRQ